MYGRYTCLASDGNYYEYEANENGFKPLSEHPPGVQPDKEQCTQPYPEFHMKDIISSLAGK
ncbi:AGAP006006-PA-like protein [Anopheles sinensis]|uniref:AGAP006006-PA-like protein n=1 Tax=Anopheles sinensis TaxID=74873 RepID=A0A084W0T2_ANOSI|nr:AGAP006006-PA-like protein [Anopheles sinensis]